ncbi:MAG: mandelate racemase/muconate lactonizing enzyme family protein [Acetobacteraceae bacterium]|nr:mandelate racemase/muconate lactonizing enzyme family protein [Acetobacteraceae bacterium]
MLRVRSVEVFDIDFNHLPRPHNFIVVRVNTEDGPSGIGEAAMIYGDGAKAAAAQIRHLAAKYVIGWPVEQTSALWTKILRESFWGPGGGPAHWGAVAALDQALWDIKGKLAGRPVWALLGGGLRTEIELYVNGWYGHAVTPEEFAERAARVVADGYRALKFDPYRMTADGRFAFPPAQIDEDFARLGLARVAAVRRAVGPDVKLMLDLHGMLSVTNAIRLGRRFAEYDLYFFEDPVETLSAPWFREIRDAVPLPLAGGDRLYTRYEVRPFLEPRSLDILQCDIGLSGGFTEMMRIAALAETYGVDLAPHNCAGPINTAASLQFVASVPNILIQEWFPYWRDDRYEILCEPLERRPHAPRIAIPDRPGLGVELNEEFVRRYPCTVIDRAGWRTVA